MNKQVLLIEDHDSLRRLMGVFLSRNFRVVAAKNGLEAMGWLSKGEIPDVIVTDVRMPELGGAQLLSNLRSSGLYGDIPVVVVSGSGEEVDEQTFKQLGATAFFRKPFNPSQLQERLLQITDAGANA